MTREKFERAQEIREELSQSYDMLWLVENYAARVKDKELRIGKIVYHRDDEDINTANPPKELCEDIINVINHYISKLDGEFENL